VLGKGEAEALVPHIVAEDALECLQKGEIVDDGRARRVVPSDLAVLVRKNRQALAMQRALARRGIPAVVGSSGSVFDTDEALLAERFLAALVDDGGEGTARALALSPLFGMSARELDHALTEAPDRWAEVQGELALMRRALEREGVSRAFALLFERRDVMARLCAEPEGERAITNLRHLVELLHRAESERRLGAEGLLAHLRDRRYGPTEDEEGEALRLESDDDAVRIVTLHKSKGLEYPIVFLSHLWDGALLRANASLLRFHDPDDGGRIALDLGLDEGDEARARHRALAEREALRENLRLAYVGFTRARHMALAYFGPVNAGSGHASKEGYESSALACLLHGGAVPADAEAYALDVRARVGAVLHRKDADPARLAEVFEGDIDALVARARSLGPARIDVSRCERPGDARHAPEGRVAPTLAVRAYDRAGFDPSWGRHSYTALVRWSESSEPAAPEREGAWDEPAIEEATLSAAPAALEALPLAAFPRGAEAGTFVHRVLERIDFRDGRDRRTGHALPEAVEAIGRAAGFEDPGALGALAAALPKVLATPLGAALGELSLDRIPTEDRLDELPFDLPLGGGTRASSRTAVTAAALVEALRRRAPDERLDASYLRRLDALRFPPVGGFLTGSIDLVFRADVDGRRQYFVADYKTNSLGEGEPHVSRPRDYGLAGMRRAMADHHYYLQYHLYLVALHRFLGHRLGAAYDYDRDVGGAFYLFVRGMLGPSTEREGTLVRGVFFDKPPREVIEAIAALFERPIEEGAVAS
jgi:exodeoxyribonuclease V beta subunit